MTPTKRERVLEQAKAHGWKLAAQLESVKQAEVIALLEQDPESVTPPHRLTCRHFKANWDTPSLGVCVFDVSTPLELAFEFCAVFETDHCERWHTRLEPISLDIRRAL